MAVTREEKMDLVGGNTPEELMDVGLQTLLQVERDHYMDRVFVLEQALKQIYAERGEDDLISSICNEVLV